MKLSPDLADALKNEGGKKKVEVKIADSANLDSFRKITDKYELEKSGEDIYSFHGKLNSDQVYELSQLREVTAMSLAE
jgi:hypothetical protein